MELRLGDRPRAAHACCVRLGAGALFRGRVNIGCGRPRSRAARYLQVGLGPLGELIGRAGEDVGD